MEFDMEKLRSNNNPLLRRVSRQMDSKKSKPVSKSMNLSKNNSLGSFDLLDEEPMLEAPVQKTKLELYMGRNLGRGGRR